MRIFELKEIPAKGIVKSLAKSCHVEYEDNFGEYMMRFPKSIGRGLVRGINFPNGVGLFTFKFEMKEDTCFNFSSQSIHPFKFVYCIQGNFQHYFSNEDITHEISDGQSLILGSNYQSGNKFLFKQGSSIHLKFLDIERERFVDQLTFPLEQMGEIYHNIFADTNALRTLYHHTQYSLKMAYLADEIDSFKSKGLERTIFYGAKSLELLSYMMMLYKDDLQGENGQIVVREHDLKKINQVIYTIENNLEELGNISEMARVVDISEAKLQEGFKILFNQTVNEYIQTKRLERAMNLLLHTNKSISEIVYAVGLNSRSHFSKIFKQRYNVSPKIVRASRQKNI
ncbi:AraC family transcriptional regulator [Gramella sp. AN32]|uniref:Helix-turn-helix domain-containing protein n=1 Tax=Christiangramia antarctica TaxID=2058158 RepID=A0ABW5X0G3_9FLAO|nr:AraC family transcriptional regulator [Gramella sp. AN32]MCM4154962.1 hypothetical protein [Gramella sp. AN32]